MKEKKIIIHWKTQFISWKTKSTTLTNFFFIKKFGFFV